MVTRSGKELGDETWALVPARSGSRSIADKNLQLLQGHSLLAWAAVAGVATPEVSRTFVSTDSAAYAEIARRYDAEVPFLRPGDVSDDVATDADVFAHFLDWAISSGLSLPHAILHLRPTTPSRSIGELQDAIKLARSADPEVTSLRSVHIAPESPFKWFLTDDLGRLTTLAGDRALDQANMGRQSYPSVYVPNGVVDVVFPHKFLATGQLHGDCVLPIVTDEVVEVDTSHALDLLRAMAPIPEELRRVADSYNHGPE